MSAPDSNRASGERPADAVAPSEADETGVIPAPETIADVFSVYEVERTDDAVRYYGQPRVDREAVVPELAPLFRRRGYTVSLELDLGEDVLVVSERSVGVDGIPWKNVAMFAATVVTTLFAGTRWYGIPVFEEPLRLLEAWPFAVAVLSVLLVHELGHYVASRYHGVEATLPFFIPVPNFLGTFGAVIRMNDHMPDRKALFDIGVAGPLAGLAVTVVVTAVGVVLPPVEAALPVRLGYPPLLQLIAAGLGEPLTYADSSLMANPIVIGGWVGAFVTFLNLLPVGQLDGGHVLHALFPDAQPYVQRVVPGALFALAVYTYLFADGNSLGLWLVWGVLLLLFGRAGSATPLDESDPGRARLAVGVLTFVLGVLSFTPVPVTML
jgi:membrane-associated protease RseP (regulator of RpoE activity)